MHLYSSHEIVDDFVTFCVNLHTGGLGQEQIILYKYIL